MDLEWIGGKMGAMPIAVTLSIATIPFCRNGKAYADRIRRRAPARGDKWRLDELVVSIAGQLRWLWRAVDQNGSVLDVLVRRRRDSRMA
jgi:putative transposase